MCGLAGFNFNIEKEELAQAVREHLFPRGPDQQGQFFDQKVRLISTRLKVQDLNAGDQPYSETYSPWVLLYNGELYNKNDLQKELENKGHTFNTHSDTEVIYKIFLQFGKAGFSKINGMYALAFYNKENHDLILKTDKYGIKPLYILIEGKKFSFSSNLTTFKVLNPGIKISEKGIIEFLKYNYNTFNSTLYKGVKRLRPDTLFTINLKNLSHKEVHYEEFFKKASGDQKGKLSELLDKAIGRQLISDRKTGVFLSSGVDSSFLCAKAYQKNHSINAYNISFLDKSYDEFPLAKIQAKFSGISLERHDFNESVFLENFHNFVLRNESPLADPGLFPLFQLCEEIKDKSTVLLSGDGGDELFAGYSTILATLAVQESPSFLKGTLSLALKNIAILFQNDHKDMISYKMKQFGNNLTKPPLKAHASWRNVFTFSELTDLAPDYNIQEDMFDESYLQYQKSAEKLFPNDLINQLLYLDFKHWLPLNNFLKLDMATSSHSLEGRVPYLDNELVDYLFSLKGKEKWSLLKNKRLLRNECKGLVAPEVLNSPKKPFHPPYRIWFKAKSKDFIESTILNSSLVKDHGVKEEALKKIFDENNRGQADHTFKIYNLLYLSKWLELH